MFTTDCSFPEGGCRCCTVHYVVIHLRFFEFQIDASEAAKSVLRQYFALN